MNVKHAIPMKVKEFYWRRIKSPNKHQSELDFWRRVWKEENHRWDNAYYRQHLLKLAGEDSDEFLTEKIVADFGCGPRGSLWWATSSKHRIGIDVLADVYSEFDLKSQNMVYVTSTESSIPLPSNYVDVLYTSNALDHVDNLEIMCKELVRIITPGGELIGSFNLGEPATATEPQSLDEELLDRVLLKYFDIKSYKVAARSAGTNPYENFYIDDSPTATSGERFIWVRATKPMREN